MRLNVRNLDQADTLESFEHIKPSRAKVKQQVDKQAERKIADLEDQVGRLSKANLELTAFLRRVLIYAPPALREQYAEMKEVE